MDVSTHWTQNTSRVMSNIILQTGACMQIKLLLRAIITVPVHTGFVEERTYSSLMLSIVLDNKEETVHLLGTVFSDELVHIWSVVSICGMKPN